MARTSAQRWRDLTLAARRVPVTVPAESTMADRADRMARFAAGAHRLVARAAAVGVLLAAGWLLAMLFGMLSATPAAADSTAAPVVAGSITDDFPTAGEAASVTGNAEAMAGLKVDGLTSQSTPGMPDPSTATKNMGANGLAPNAGGNGPFGPGVGDIARSLFDPRFTAQRAPLACVLPPVVRTAADDPSFSPD